jgi:RAQPRD family integrative conjugative element protein
MKYKAWVLACLIGVPWTAYCDVDAEREALAKIIHELEAIKPLINEARSQANPDSRIRFQYDWLLLDLQRIKAGITEHLYAPQTHPRHFPPLKGDYRH